MIRASACLAVIGSLFMGCAHAPPLISMEPTTIEKFSDTLNWLTMQAEQKVTVNFQKDDGTHEERVIHGLVAVARPNKLRLRALGPAGVTLFDMIVIGDHVTVVDAKTKDASFLTLVEAIGDDLRLAYQLLPTEIGQKLVADETHATITDGVRKIVLDDFRRVNGKQIFSRAHLDNSAFHYKVEIEVTSAQMDLELPPDMFHAE